MRVDAVDCEILAVDSGVCDCPLTGEQVPVIRMTIRPTDRQSPVVLAIRKLERFHGTIKKECIRPACPRTYDEAKRQISNYVKHYNETRLHAAIGYVTPADCLGGLAEEIHAERDRKLEEARARRRQQSQNESLALAS